MPLIRTFLGNTNRNFCNIFIINIKFNNGTSLCTFFKKVNFFLILIIFEYGRDK